MRHSNYSAWTLRAILATALITEAASAGAKLESVAVTPTAPSISVGQRQSFTATGKFSNGSKHKLGPAIGSIAAGFGETCALLNSGGVECWGTNSLGQLGDGNRVSSLIPRPVKGISTATAVALPFEGTHACALLAGGAVECWGDGADGRLGNGSARSSNTPVFVTGISTAAALALGDYHSCALLASGAVECWGFNGLGQLGNASNADSYIPVPVTGISTAIALGLGTVHSCAVLASGAVQCWGYNAYGQLGNGTTTDSNNPVTVSGISNATAVAAGDAHSCALLATGAVMCWGYNLQGQLGDGANGYNAGSNIPVPVTGISTATAITAGYDHACAVLRSGAVKCWGWNAFGQLGDGTANYSNDIPVTVRGTYAPTKLSGGTQHTCALFSGGVMTCWGGDLYGELGNRKTTASANPLPVTVVGTPGVMWTSSDPTVATVTDRGVAMGRAVGNTTITATTAGFINDNAVLTVK